MKPCIKHVTLSLICFIILSCKDNTNLTDTKASIDLNTSNYQIPDYKPSNQALHDTIVAMDKKYFDAYNTCDLETQASMYADDIEFYHDLGGIETNKNSLIQAIKENICDKVTRQLVAGSMEVYPITNYGAVAEGYHVFFNKMEPDAPKKPSKFMMIWKDTETGWKISRIVSLH